VNIVGGVFQLVGEMAHRRKGKKRDEFYAGEYRLLLP
jgi:hypothetical protein